ncbi:MAG: hypothetical protein RAK22_00455 [Nanoarchaeota archaeon]|nr:hypothetical protein [Nanoarchaeota archaeon]
MQKSKKPMKKRKKIVIKKKSKPSKKPVKKNINKAQRKSKVVVDTKKLLSLEDAVKYISDFVGEKGLEIFEYLVKHGATEENKLASKLGFDRTNNIRKFLYLMYSRALVSYVRSKRGRKAWYTYTWHANPDQLIFLLKQMYQNDIDQIKKSIELDKVEDYYICNYCNRLYDVATALQNDFKCVNCGRVLEHVDTKEVLQSRQQRIDELKKRIAYLDSLIKTRSSAKAK